MGFFKPSAEPASNKFIARLQSLIWILIYGGLLTLVLGVFAERLHDAIGWSLVVGGGLAAAVGFALIYVRSRIKTGP